MSPWDELGLKRFGRDSMADLVRAMSALRASIVAMDRGAQMVTAKYPSEGVRMPPTVQTTFDVKLIHFYILRTRLQAKTDRNATKTISVNYVQGQYQIEEMLKDKIKWGDMKHVTEEEKELVGEAMKQMQYGLDKHAPAGEKIRQLNVLQSELDDLMVLWKKAGGKGFWTPRATN